MMHARKLVTSFLLLLITEMLVTLYKVLGTPGPSADHPAHCQAEQMINPDTGAPHTAHTTNPVPFIMTGDPKEYSFSSEPLAGAEEGEEVPSLGDVAPTILDLMVSLVSLHCSI